VSEETIIAGTVAGTINNPEESQPSSVFVDVSDYISTLQIPKSYYWTPMEDITTYELALCVPLFGIPRDNRLEYAVNRLPDNAKRHFKEC